MKRLIREYIPFTAVLASFILFLRPIGSDGDFFHHILTGRFILETGSFPTKDLWSYTAQGQPYTAHSWLSGIIFYLIYSRMGAAGISIFVAGIAACTLLLLNRILLRLDANSTGRAAALVVVAVMIRTRLPARPELFLYPLGTLIILNHMSLRPGFRRTVLTSGILILWTNLYGASVWMGVALSLLLLATDARRTVWTALLLICCAAAVFMRPYPIDSLLYAGRIASIRPFQGEWASLWEILRDAPFPYLLEQQWSILLYAASIALLLTATLSGIRRRRSGVWTVLACGAAAGILAWRYAGAGILFAAPWMAIGFSCMSGRVNRHIPILAATTMLAISLVTLPPSLPAREQPFSPALIRFMKEHRLRGNAFNNQHIGAFLSYNLFPDVRILVDTRDEVYLSTNIFRDVVDIIGQARSIIPLLAKYNADMVIADYVTGGLSFAPLFTSPDWSVVFIDNTLLVAVPSKIAASRGLPVFTGFDPFALDGVKPNRINVAYAEARRIFDANPEGTVNRTALASASLAAGKPEDAIRILADTPLTWTADGIFTRITVHSLLVRAFLQKKDCVRASAALMELERDRMYPALLRKSTDLSAEFTTQERRVRSLCNNPVR